MVVSEIVVALVDVTTVVSSTLTEYSEVVGPKSIQHHFNVIIMPMNKIVMSKLYKSMFLM